MVSPGGEFVAYRLRHSKYLWYLPRIKKQIECVIFRAYCNRYRNAATMAQWGWEAYVKILLDNTNVFGMPFSAQRITAPSMYFHLPD